MNSKNQLLLFLSTVLFSPLVLFSCNNVAEEKQLASLFDLNHFYVSIDRETFEAFRDHPELLSRYFEADSGMPGFDPVTDSTGIIYLRGETIYMELMGPDNRFGVAEGVIGIGFSEDSALPLEENWDVRIGEIFGEKEVGFGQNSYTYLGNEIRWFDTAYIPDTTTTVYTWYSRYNPEFLSAITDEVHTEYTRDAYLSLARSGKKRVENVKSLTLALVSNDFDRIRDELKAINAPNEENANQSIYKVGDAEVRLIKSEETSRLVEVEFSLNENHDCAYQAGSIEIRCEDDRLRMRFRLDK